MLCTMYYRDHSPRRPRPPRASYPTASHGCSIRSGNTYNEEEEHSICFFDRQAPGYLYLHSSALQSMHSMPSPPLQQ